jgi:phenylpropionate dioxygenase-like ring-hydroxylating dioxygenase large terminal subunit
MQTTSVVGQIFAKRQMQTKNSIREQYNIFSRTDRVAVGWYWLLPSKAVKRQKVVAANIVGIELAVFRKSDGRVAALSAYCPHMGAHLAEGQVDNDQLRCFFHNWCFNDKGECTDIPCLSGKAQRTVTTKSSLQTGTAKSSPQTMTIKSPPHTVTTKPPPHTVITKPPSPTVTTKSWVVQERHGLIWIWLGEGKPSESIPEPPDLQGTEFQYSVGNFFIKNCHPNVVMVNAIDEQHFHTVHNLPGDVLNMEPNRISTTHIEFKNTSTVPNTNVLGRALGKFYNKYLTYNLNYWYGSSGTVTLGPDFLHLYLMFALRMSAQGKTEGYAVAFARKPTNLVQHFLNPFVLLITKLAGLYFAKGDTRIFNTIKFDFKTPIAADHAVLAFIQHLDRQSVFSLSEP